ncbi:MAG: iron-containing alcohol dehydrogenase [Oscillospiraceae bacterium]|nr:iron-containing alcohol dehydrogenase [Oscillospiraceae bacterium]
MSSSFRIPKQIIYGKDALENCISLLPNGKALIVTGNIVRRQACFTKLKNLLDSNGISYCIFSDINGEPTDKMVNAGLKAYTENGCSFFIAVGGGSPMDLMKAVATLTVGHGTISDYMGKNIDMKLPFMAAIPTTAGTGSEATQFTAITDTEKDVKMLLKGEGLIPDLAILDSDFTVTAPPSVTTYTGLDALTHAIESYTSRKAQTLTNSLALLAIKRICTYLPMAYQDGSNREARYQMSIAALEAGVCINNASVTIVHGMSRPIGALFHLPHGLSNAILLSKCLAFAMPGALEDFAEIGWYTGVAKDTDSVQLAAKSFLNRVDEICHVCQVKPISSYGVDHNAFFAVIDKMADDAMASGSPSNTKRDVTKEDIKQIYRSLW